MWSLFVIGAMTALTLFLTVALTWSIFGNLRQGERYREGLVQRLAKLRLHRALDLFGIDSGRYLHTQNIAEVESQMRACAECGATDRCDDSLEKSDAADFDFCPNHSRLESMGQDPGLRRD